MTLQIQSWEYRLLDWAHKPLSEDKARVTVQAESSELHAAYAVCADLTRLHSRTFYIASGLLPTEKRSAARALYAFCRITDNIIDDAPDSKTRLTQLEAWRRIVMSPIAPTNQPVALAWAEARSRFAIPRGYAQQLIEGVARDLVQTRYANFDQLAEYAYGVASTVGLMAMHITGYSSDRAIPYAVKLGVALQLTNILRDVAEDYRNGRLYLPQDELSAYNLSERDIEDGVVDDRWRAFMRFQVERTRRLYDEAQPGIALLDADGRFAIAAASTLYRAILDDIEAHDYNVFLRRAHLSLGGKLRRLPAIWWMSRSVSV
ncbi:MAG: phytoene/squalene synthase family protein [Chloroflexi bacterium]|nr:phytoene/squalene synthase family protein [Chloroflexota bacterium]